MMRMRMMGMIKVRRKVRMKMVMSDDGGSEYEDGEETARESRVKMQMEMLMAAVKLKMMISMETMVAT